MVTDGQGDRIGRIFAHILGDFFHRALKINESEGAQILGHFFQGKNHVPTYVHITFGNYELGNILGDFFHFGRFFTNSSGHPADGNPCFHALSSTF
jgi:hypothetical protein